MICYNVSGSTDIPLKIAVPDKVKPKYDRLIVKLWLLGIVHYACFDFVVASIVTSTDSADKCPDGWTSTCFGTCLKFINLARSFQDAKEACLSHDAKLVTLHSQERMIFVEGYIKQESK